MITIKTALVLGAGASEPYGFPTGSVLVSLLQSIGVAKQLESAGIDLKHFRRFFETLGAAQPYSIDEFLENRPEFQQIGTMAVAACLLPAEHKSLTELNDLSKTNHWYRHLKAHLSGPFQQLGENNLRIITFNYDRSLEHYLCTTLCYTYGKSAEECAAQLAPIEVLHIYGSLGPLLWQQNADLLPYGPADVTLDMIGQASQNIKIMHEGSEDAVQRHFEKAKEWLKWADRILFLGFGFHPDNVKRLALDKTLCNKREVIATCKGLDLTSRQAAEFCTPNTNPRAIGSARSITFPDPNADCYRLLHDYVVLS